MARITVNVHDEWLQAARAALGTDSDVVAINEALRTFAMRKRAAAIVSAFDSIPMDFSGSEFAWGYFGGRDLEHLADRAEGHT